MTEQIREQAINWQIRLQQAPHQPWLQWRFRQWLKRDAQHRQAWAEIQQFWQLSGELAAPQTPAQGKARHWPQAVAACLALSVALLWFELQPAANQALAQVDGSQIWPRPGSQFSVQMDAQQRHVQLEQGAVYFDVSPEARPFVVDAGQVQIRVLGTAFSVEYDSGSVLVSVERGSVSVNGQTVQAQQQLRVTVAPGSGAQLSTLPGPVAPWREGQLQAHNASIAELSEQLGALYPGVILIQDQSLLSQRVSGRFALQHTEQSLAQMVRPFGAQVRHYWPGVLVVSGAEK